MHSEVVLRLSEQSFGVNMCLALDVIRVVVAVIGDVCGDVFSLMLMSETERTWSLFGECGHVFMYCRSINKANKNKLAYAEYILEQQKKTPRNAANKTSSRSNELALATPPPFYFNHSLPFSLSVSLSHTLSFTSAAHAAPALHSARRHTSSTRPRTR